MSVRSDVAVVGLGYIGLPTAAAIAIGGRRVTGVDVNAYVVAEVNAGRVPIVEPLLDEIVHQAVARGFLNASTEVPSADAYIIAVPTPFKDGYDPDTSYIESAVAAIAPKLTGGEIVILESTSPPGTTESISTLFAKIRPDLRFPHEFGDEADVNLAHCPERVLPGRIMIEIYENDRVIGGVSQTCAEKAATVYRDFVRGNIHLTDSKTAELSKLVENAYRDVNIAFANEIAEVCSSLNLDVWNVIELANRHPRVNVLNPGPGVGGHCIAVDPWFIVASAPEKARIIRTAREVNDARPQSIVDKVHEAVAGREDLIVGFLGLAFKADVDDLRQSPAVYIVQKCADTMANRILVAEPYVSSLPKQLIGTGTVDLASTSEVLAQADVVVLLVDHTEFKNLNPEQLGEKTVVDTRGAWRSAPHGADAVGLAIEQGKFQ
jgi:UDP-N-acetyl-D-mannosaminuronic acid dehydrogenase